MGRPSIDPELMIRMLIVGYCFGIRSERRLCEEVHLNLAYRWFCRLGLDGDVPDHSTFSKNRHGRFRDSDLLRELFETRRAPLHRGGAGRRRGLRGRRQPDQGRRQQAALGRRVETVDWAALAETPAARSGSISTTLDDAALGAASEVDAEVHLAGPIRRRNGPAPMKGHAFFAYATNYLIDLDHAVIVDVEATPRDPPGRGRRGAHA